MKDIADYIGAGAWIILAITAIVMTSIVTHRPSPHDIGEQCDALGGFVVADRIYECRLKGVRHGN